MKYFYPLFFLVNVLLYTACENSNTPAKTIVESEKNHDVFLKRGQQVAAVTFKTLSGKLQKSMKEGGVSNALKYCNLAAMPLVDSLSQIHNADIRRTSLKIRNPKDQPTPLELTQLQSYEKQSKAGEKLKAVVKEIDPNTVAFYAPIHIMPLCEKCHGKVGSTLLEKDYDVVQKLYPEDQAIGYVSGDFRGMWSITFKK
ncbi:MAG: DUF3365 domain-containing protein [Saprospiraceae bacterium]